jgi:hypothetical protein
MESNHIAGLALATALWIGLGACALLGGGSLRPNGEFWTSTASDRVASRPTLVRAAYATPSGEPAAARARFAAR